MQTDEERRAVLERQTRQVILEQKVAFAKQEDEDDFVRSAVEKAMRGESFYFPFSFDFKKPPELLFAHYASDPCN